MQVLYNDSMDLFTQHHVCCDTGDCYTFSIYINKFPQMTKYRSFGQIISFGPRSIQLRMGKSVAIGCVATHVILSNQIHGIIASQFHSEFDNLFDQKNKKRSFGQLISLGQ